MRMGKPEKRAKRIGLGLSQGRKKGERESEAARMAPASSLVRRTAQGNGKARVRLAAHWRAAEPWLQTANRIAVTSHSHSRATGGCNLDGGW